MMCMTKAMQARNAFAHGCNCSQAVLGAFAPALGLTPDQAMKLACGFGGGMRLGETCGAVTGAIMVVGLRHGNASPADKDAKAHTYQTVSQLAAEFRKRHGTVCCRELLGCDVSQERGMAEAQALGLFTSKCPQYVASAVEILEEMEVGFSAANV